MVMMIPFLIYSEVEKAPERSVYIAYRLKICYTDFIALALMYGGYP